MAERRVVLVTVAEALGSAPRDAGTWMAVGEGGVEGTIGGGALEWRATEAAREMLTQAEPEPRELSLPLGPALNQCCGGFVRLKLKLVEPERLAVLRGRTLEGAPLLALYGAGHVGRAMVRALEELPVSVLWVDDRPSAFPERVPGNCRTKLSDDPAAVASDLPENAFHLVMTHSHPLDLSICEAVLKRGRFAWLGLIGSSTKKARFLSQLRACGITEAAVQRMVCPIGIAGISGKEPAVIAASVTAQLLIAFEARRSLQRMQQPQHRSTVAGDAG